MCTPYETRSEGCFCAIRFTHLGVKSSSEPEPAFATPLAFTGGRPNFEEAPTVTGCAADACDFSVTRAAVGTLKSAGRDRHCPMVCSAVAVLFDPSAGVALQAFQPFTRVRGIELRRFDGREVFAAGLSFLRSKHVLRKFASSPRHRQIQPGRREHKCQFVGHAKPGELPAISLRPISGMPAVKAPHDSPKSEAIILAPALRAFHRLARPCRVLKNSRYRAARKRSTAGHPTGSRRVSPGGGEKPGINHSAMCAV